MLRKLSVGLFLLLDACTPARRHETTTNTLQDVIYDESFDLADTSAWVIESEDDIELKNVVSDGALNLDVAKGITVWNTTKFKGNVMFEFAATVIDAGGKNDRVSDLNCFWMATDPKYPDNFFERSSWRNGIFWNYYSLNLYYVGYGGHDNSKTRMRKYEADLPPPPPILKEYDEMPYLIQPNKKNIIRIACFDSTTAYFINGRKLFDLMDNRPYQEGYFGFRTTHSHLKIDHFKVFSLAPTAASSAVRKDR